MENLNAKLAQRNSNQVTQVDSRGRSQGDGNIAMQRSVPQSTHGMTAPHISGSERTQSTLVPQGHLTHPPPSFQESQKGTNDEQGGSAIYDYPTHVYTQDRLSMGDMEQDLPPPPEDFMTDKTPSPPPESAFQAAIREKSAKLKRTETMDRSAPRISND